ncbi:MAG: tyrosine-type recombinase/integrase, partial [Gemmataceae bacterium]
MADFLAELRQNSSLKELPAGDSFKPGEVADLFGISGTAVAGYVRRLNLPAEGNGKARRYPRATVEVIALARTRGCGPQTANHYLKALRSFVRWMMNRGRIIADPLATLTLANAELDKRRSRRVLRDGEVSRLLQATNQSGRTFRGLAGPDRYTLYLTALASGFRANALANLKPEYFDFAEGTVTLPAQYAKNRRTKVQPLPGDVVPTLETYLAGKPQGCSVWGGTWAED